MFRNLITEMEKDALTPKTVEKMLGPGLENMLTAGGTIEGAIPILKHLATLAKKNPQEYARTVERLGNVISRTEILPNIRAGKFLNALVGVKMQAPSPTSMPIEDLLSGIRPQLMKRFKPGTKLIEQLQGRILRKIPVGDYPAIAKIWNTRKGINWQALGKASPGITQALASSISEKDVPAILEAVMQAQRGAKGYVADVARMYGRVTPGTWMRKFINSERNILSDPVFGLSPAAIEKKLRSKRLLREAAEYSSSRDLFSAGWGE